MKMVLGVSAPLQFGSDVTLQNQYGVLPNINHRSATVQPSSSSSSQPNSNLGLSIISAPAPIANRQPDHPPAQHFRHADHDSGIRGQRAAQFKAANLTFDPTQYV